MRYLLHQFLNIFNIMLFNCIHYFFFEKDFYNNHLACNQTSLNSDPLERGSRIRNLTIAAFINFIQKTLIFKIDLPNVAEHLRRETATASLVDGARRVAEDRRAADDAMSCVGAAKPRLTESPRHPCGLFPHPGSSLIPHVCARQSSECVILRCQCF